MAYCGNCSYNCCCSCSRHQKWEKNKKEQWPCWYCGDTKDYVGYSRWCQKNTICFDKKGNAYGLSCGTRCSWEMFGKSKLVCWKCRKVWEKRRKTDDDKYITSIREEKDNCSSCREKAEYVHHTIRFPKYGEIRKWNLLREIIHYDFSKYPTGSLGEFWSKNKGLGCTLHLTDKERKQFWIPKHKREIPEWIEHMKKDK